MRRNWNPQKLFPPFSGNTTTNSKHPPPTNSKEVHFNDKVQYSPEESRPSAAAQQPQQPPAAAIERRKRKLSNPVQLPSYCNSSQQLSKRSSKIVSENRSDSPKRLAHPRRTPPEEVGKAEEKKHNGNPSSSSGSSSPVEVTRNIEENNIASKC